MRAKARTNHAVRVLAYELAQLSAEVDRGTLRPGDPRYERYRQLLGHFDPRTRDTNWTMPLPLHVVA